MRAIAGRRLTAAERDELVAGYEASGLTAIEYCAQARISPSSFYRWSATAQSRELARIEPRARATRFVPLTGMATASESGWEVELDLGDGMTLRLRRR